MQERDQSRRVPFNQALAEVTLYPAAGSVNSADGRSRCCGQGDLTYVAPLFHFPFSRLRERDAVRGDCIARSGWIVPATSRTVRAHERTSPVP